MEEDLFRCGEPLGRDSVGPNSRVSEAATAVLSTCSTDNACTIEVANSHTDRNARFHSLCEPKSLVGCQMTNSQKCVNSGRVSAVETPCSENVEDRTLFIPDLIKAAAENLTGSEHIGFIKQQYRNNDLDNGSAISDSQTSTDNNVSEISATPRHRNCTVQEPVKHMTLEAETAINHITSQIYTAVEQVNSQVYTAVEQVHSRAKISMHSKDSVFDSTVHKAIVDSHPSSQDIPPVTQTVSHLSSSVHQTQKPGAASEARLLHHNAEFSIDTPVHSNNPSFPAIQQSSGSLHPGTVDFSSSELQHSSSEAQSDDLGTIIVANSDSVPSTLSNQEKLQFENTLQHHHLDLNRTVHIRAYDMQGTKNACISENSNLQTQTVSQNLQSQDGHLDIQKELHVNSGIPTALKASDSVHQTSMKECCEERELSQTSSNIDEHVTHDSRTESHSNTSELSAGLLAAADAVIATQAHGSDGDSTVITMTHSSSLENSSTFSPEGSLYANPCVDARSATVQESSLYADSCVDTRCATVQESSLYADSCVDTRSATVQESNLNADPCVDTRSATVQASDNNSVGILEAADAGSVGVETMASGKTSHGQAQLQCGDMKNKTVADHSFDIQTAVEGTKIDNETVVDHSFDIQTAVEGTKIDNETVVDHSFDIQTAVEGTKIDNEIVAQKNDPRIQMTLIDNDSTSLAEMKLRMQHTSVSSQSVVKNASLEVSSDLQDACSESQTALRHTNLGLETASVNGCCETQTAVTHTDVSVDGCCETQTTVTHTDVSVDGCCETQTAVTHTDVSVDGCCETQTAVTHTDVSAGTSGQESDPVLTDTDITISVTEINNSGVESSSAVQFISQEIKSNLQEDTHEIQTNMQTTISKTPELTKEVENTVAVCGDRIEMNVDTCLVQQDKQPKAYSFTNDNSFNTRDALGDDLDIREPNIISEDRGSLHVINTEALEHVENGNSGIQLTCVEDVDVHVKITSATDKKVYEKSVYGGVEKIDTSLCSFGGDEKYFGNTENIGNNLGICVGENIDKKGEKSASVSGGKVDMNLKKAVNNDKVDMSLGESVGDDKTELSLGKSVNDDKVDMGLGKSVNDDKVDMSLGKSVNDDKVDMSLGKSVNDDKVDMSLGKSVNDDKVDMSLGKAVDAGKTNVNLNKPLSDEKINAILEQSHSFHKISAKVNTSVNNKKTNRQDVSMVSDKIDDKSNFVGDEKCDTKLSASVNVEVGRNVGSAVREKCETHLGTSVPDEKMNTNLDTSVGNEKSDTNLSASVLNEKSETNLSASVGIEKSDTNLSASVLNEKSDTNLSASVLNEKSDTNFSASVGNEKSDTNLSASVGNEKSNTNLETCASNEKIHTNASIYVSDGDDTNFSIYVSDADDTHGSIYVSDGDEDTSVHIVSVSDGDDNTRDTPEAAARKLPKLKVVLKRCDTSQTSLYNHRPETPDSNSSESHTSEIPKKRRKGKRSSDGSLTANNSTTKSLTHKHEESKLSQKGIKRAKYTSSHTRQTSLYNHRLDASDSQSSESHTSEMPKMRRKRKRPDGSQIANSSKTRSYKQKLDESKLSQKGIKKAKYTLSDSSQTSLYNHSAESSDSQSSESYTPEKLKKRKKLKRSSVRTLIANNNKTKSYKQKLEESKLSHKSVKKAKNTLQKSNNSKSTRGGKSQTGSNTARKSTTVYSKQFKPLKTCVYVNQNKRTRPSRYFNLRSLDVMRNLRSKAGVSGNNDKTSESNSKTLAQKKKSYTAKVKHKPPPESPPLDPTLPFVEVDLDIVVDESQYFEPIEPAVEDTQPQPQPEQRKKKRGKLKAHKVSTGSNSTVSSGSQFIDAAVCDLKHKCCQKALMTTSDMSTQWEDPSRWYAALETLTSKAMRSNVKTELTDVNSDQVTDDAFIRDMAIVQGDQNFNLQGDQNFNLQGDQNYNLQGDQNFNLQGDQNYNMQGDQNYNMQGDQNFNLQGDQNFNLQGDQNYNLQGDQNFNLQGDNLQGDQSYNLRGGLNYNLQGDQNYNSEGGHNYNLQGGHNYNLQGDQNYNLQIGQNYEQPNQQYLPTYSYQNTAEDIKMAAGEPLLSAFSRPGTVSSTPGNLLPAAAEDIPVGWPHPQSSHLFGAASSPVVPVSLTSVLQTSQDLCSLNFQYDPQPNVHPDSGTTHSNTNHLKSPEKKSGDISKDLSSTKDSHSPATPHNLSLKSRKKKKISKDSAISIENSETAAPPRNLDLKSRKKKSSSEILIDSVSSTEDSRTTSPQHNLDLKSRKKKSGDISKDLSSTKDSHSPAPQHNLDLKSRKKKKSRAISIDSASSSEDSPRNFDVKSRKKRSREISIDSVSSTEDSCTAASPRNLDLKSQKKKKKKSMDTPKDSTNSTKDSNKAAPPHNSGKIRKKLNKNNKPTGGNKKRRKDSVQDDSEMIVIDDSDSDGSSDVDVVCIE